MKKSLKTQIQSRYQPVYNKQANIRKNEAQKGENDEKKYTIQHKN